MRARELKDSSEPDLSSPSAPLLLDRVNVASLAVRPSPYDTWKAQAAHSEHLVRLSHGDWLREGYGDYLLAPSRASCVKYEQWKSLTSRQRLELLYTARPAMKVEADKKALREVR